MTEVVVALLMFLNGNMIEFTYKDSMSKCLKSKRIAMREINPDSVVFTCKKVTAETEIYQERKKILKTINSISSKINIWCWKMLVRRKYYCKKDDYK